MRSVFTILRGHRRTLAIALVACSGAWEGRAQPGRGDTEGAASPVDHVDAALERAVVQIRTTTQVPMFDLPWQFRSTQTSTGSGFVIEGGRIMTSAHVVSWAKQILVRRFQDPRWLPARVAFMGHDCDLAVLELEDPEALADIQPLEFGQLPAVRTSVVTAGYPAGGRQISFTQGVVSRIEMQPYMHIRNRSFLAVQTDAAINPGNSGGPVLQNQKVVGVAFQGMPDLQNAGFFIPPEVISHFLVDIADDHYDGFPMAGMRLKPLQSPTYRHHLGLKDDGLGARVDFLDSQGTAVKFLRPDDVLLEVNGVEVGSDAMVAYRGNRVDVGVIIQTAQCGERIDMTIWREGAALEVDFLMEPYFGNELTYHQHDVAPRYFIYGGLVFTPLSLDYVATMGQFGRDRFQSDWGQLVYELVHHPMEDPDTAREEPVVLAAVLPHPVNADLNLRDHLLVDRINGVRIERLEDVQRAFSGNEGERHLLEFETQEIRLIEAINRQAAEEANPKILSTYNIISDQRL